MNTDSNTCVMTIVKSPAWVALIWLGMTAGISLLVTAESFSTKMLARSIAPEIEISILAALNKAEFIALILLLVLIRVSGHTRDLLLPVIVLVLILIAQATWLLPEISSQVELVTSNIESGLRKMKTVYSALELGKIFLLAYAGFRSLQILTVNQHAGE